MKKENKTEKRHKQLSAFIYRVCSMSGGAVWRGFEFRFTFSTEAAILT